MTQTIDELRTYELMLIVSGDMTEADFEREIGEIKKMLKESTKGLSYENMWGRRDLAYRIKRQGRGYYAVFNFKATPAAIIELRTNIKLNQAVLRHLLITVPEDYEPSKTTSLVLPEAARKDAADGRRKVVRPRAASPLVASEETQAPKPIVAGPEEEEQLKKVEKKLEKILENPDIEVK